MVEVCADLWAPVRLLDPVGDLVVSVVAFLNELQAAGRSAATQRSYAMDLLRWFRFGWAVDVAWDQATRVEARDFCQWLLLREKPRAGAAFGSRGLSGTPNPVTGKAGPGRDYAPATRAHSETVLRVFYDFHRDAGTGPMVNPFPLSRDRAGGRANAHHNPMEPFRNDRVVDAARLTPPPARGRVQRPARDDGAPGWAHARRPPDGGHVVDVKRTHQDDRGRRQRLLPRAAAGLRVHAPDAGDRRFGGARAPFRGCRLGQLLGNLRTGPGGHERHHRRRAGRDLPGPGACAFCSVPGDGPLRLAGGHRARQAGPAFGATAGPLRIPARAHWAAAGIHQAGKAVQVRLEWVKGHTGDPMNETADRLATLARRSARIGLEPGAVQVTAAGIVAEHLAEEGGALAAAA